MKIFFLEMKLPMGLLIDSNESISQAVDILKKVGLDVNPLTKIKNLGVGKQQLIELLKL